MYKYAYINGEPRSGKTLTSLLAISYSKSIKRILLLTKKTAISGIHKFTDDPELKHYWAHQTHTITNYESLGRYITRTTSASGKPLKKPIRELQLNYNPDDFDLVICDECFPGDTEVLTEKGYIRFDQLPKDIKVAQVTDTGIEFVYPIRYIDKLYDGNLVSIEKDNFSIVATENHRQPVIINNGQTEKTVIFGDIKKSYKIKTQVPTNNIIDKSLTLEQQQHIAFQADGSTHSNNSASFTFSKQRKIDRFLQIFPNANEVKCVQREECSERRRWLTKLPNHSKLLSDNIPLHTSIAKAFIEEVVQWDGYIPKDNRYYYYSSIVKENVDFVAAMATLAGYYCRQTIQVDNRSETFSNIHRITIYKNRPTAGLQKAVITKIPTISRVYCVEVPSSYIVVRQQEKIPFITGNCHRLGKLGKPSQTYQLVKQLTGDKPFLAMSGTPIVESPNHIYYQMSISTKTPFSQPSFYRFFDDWGIPTYLKLHGRMVTQYKQAKPELLNYIDKFTVTMSQVDANIDQANQAQDHLHYINPSAGFVKVYNQIFKDKVYTIGNQTLVCDSTMKLRTSLHQLEGGTVLIDQIPVDFGFTDKIDYIKQTWPDSPKTGIMCYYVHERELLTKHFPNSEIYSSISHAEGVDLSHLDNFIIFSFGFSGAKFVQLRNRAVNVNSQSESKVHILLTKNSISMQVYESVKNKQNFNDSLFLRKTKPI